MSDMTGIKLPCMDWEASNLPTTFKEFKEYCTLIFKGPLKDKSAEEKVTFILLWIGQEGVRTFNSWTFTDADDKKKLEVVWEKFGNHFEP